MSRIPRLASLTIIALFLPVIGCDDTATEAPSPDAFRADTGALDSAGTSGDTVAERDQHSADSLADADQLVLDVVGEDTARLDAASDVDSGQSDAASDARDVSDTPSCVDLPFTFLPGLSVTNFQRGPARAAELVRDAASFVDVFGFQPPAEIDFERSWILWLHTDGSYGGGVALSSARLCPEGWDLQAVSHEPDDSCERLSVADRMMQSMYVLDHQGVAEPVPSLSNYADHGGGVGFACSSGPTGGSPCRAGELCQSPYICAGLTLGGEGVCVPGAYHSTVTNSDAVSIPDGEAAGALSENPVVGLGQEVLDVLVTFEITHPMLSDLQVILIAPDGTERVVHDHSEWLGLGRWHEWVASDFPPDTSPNGVWKLRVVDDVPTNVGELVNWSLQISSRSP